MKDLGLYLLGGVMIASLAYSFVKLALAKGLDHALLGASILVDFSALLFMLLGIDRPLFLLCTKLGCVTITATMAFLAVKLPLTGYLAAKVLKR